MACWYRSIFAEMAVYGFLRILDVVKPVMLHRQVVKPLDTFRSCPGVVKIKGSMPAMLLENRNVLSRLGSTTQARDVER